MSRPKLPKGFVALCRKVVAKRPRTVIDHILRQGYITTEQLKNKYGYNHPPRAARDVKEQGIPLESFRVHGGDGRQIAAYRFGNPAEVRTGTHSGRIRLSKALKRSLIDRHGPKCAIYCTTFPEQELQIDHRIPFEVVGDGAGLGIKIEDFMLVCGSANRAKSWSCEHCVNWRESRSPAICRACYWAYPEDYTHVAMRAVRRADVLWEGGEVSDYERLKCRAAREKQDVPIYVKDVLKRFLGDREEAK